MSELSRVEKRKRAKRAFVALLSVTFGAGLIVGIIGCSVISKAISKPVYLEKEPINVIKEKPLPAITNTNILHESEENESAWVEFKATAYCGCRKCCGIWAENRPNGKVIGAAGVELKEGVSIAADLSVLPKGSIVEIKGLGTYIVQDTGGAIIGNKIDVYFESHEDALEFGVQDVYLRIVSK